MMSQTPRGLVLFFTGILLLCAACGSNSADEQKESLRPTEVKVVEAQRGDIATVIQATGTISPNHESYLGPRVAGRIEIFFADEGDFVEQGAPLLNLERVRFELALNEARAACAESRSAQKNVELKLKRNQELLARGVINKEAFDDMATENELARARADMARSRLERAEEDYKDSVLHAPFAGFVVERRMNTGEMFSGMPNEYVFHLVDTCTVKVEVDVFETKKQYVVPGKATVVAVDALPGRKFEGRISVVNPLVDRTSRKFLVKIEIPNPNFELESGMFARVEIPEEQSAGTLVVPAGAVIERQGRKVVFVAEAQRAVERAVFTGLTTAERVEIRAGLQPGERIIVDGLYAVKDGTPLKISP
jgi:HlyD family secretion protein